MEDRRLGDVPGFAAVWEPFAIADDGATGWTWTNWFGQLRVCGS